MEQTMTAAVFEGQGKLTLKQVPVPKIINPDDVLLKVEAAAVCGTDVHILSVPAGHPATPGAILGHEYVGEVIEVGSNCGTLKPGDKVVVDPNITCGHCSNCQMGRHNMCSEMTTLGIFINGGFAPYNVAPAGQLYPYDANLDPQIAVFCEPLACVTNAVRKIAFFPGENAVVLGGGPIGQYFIQLALMAGAGKVIVSEPNPMRKDFSLGSGAARVFNPEQEDLAQVVAEEIPCGPDVVIDAVGCLADIAVNLCGRGGRVMLFGQNENARASIAQNTITRNEITVIGSYIARHTFPEAIRILESGRLDLEPLITNKVPLEDIEQGIEAMRSGRALKVIVTF